MLWFGVEGYSTWQRTVGLAPTCSVGPADLSQHFRYIQLNVDSQRVTEPIFDGSYFVNLGTEFGKNPLRLKVKSSATGNYGATEYVADLNWDTQSSQLWMWGGKKEMNFVSTTGSHYLFPFNSAKIIETLTFDPAIDIGAVLIVNRVAGFYTPCGTFAVDNNHSGAVKVSFDLRRNPLITWAAVVLLAVAAGFAILITVTMDLRMLPGPVAAYFFSMWSIRGLFGLTPEGFPTIFDFGVLLLALLLPTLLVLRLLFSSAFVKRLEKRE